MADGILAAVNENGNIDRFIDTKGGVHYIEPKRYEESVAKIDAAATKAKETVNSATEAVSECKAQTGACTQETARAKEIADTVESRITGIEGDIATLRDSVSPSFVDCNITNVPTTVCKVGKIVVVMVCGTLKKAVGAWSTLSLSNKLPKTRARFNSIIISQDTADPRILLTASGTDLFIESKGASLPSGTWTFGQLVYICE